MDQATPPWVQLVINSNLAVAEALRIQSESINALAEAITELVESDMVEAPDEPQTYLNGKPR